MKHTAVLVDKKVAGIIRWLERFKKSYSSGAVESALMDAECARADLENLRQDVWATLDPEIKTENKFLSRLVNFSRVAVMAAVIVMTAVFPISKEVPAPALEHDKNNITLAEPIIIIREDDNKEINNNIVAEVAPKPKKIVRTAAKPPVKAPQPAPEVKVQAQQKSVAYDKVFSLIQTGQKALKNNSTVIIKN